MGKVSAAIAREAASRLALFLWHGGDSTKASGAGSDLRDWQISGQRVGKGEKKDTAVTRAAGSRGYRVEDSKGRPLISGVSKRQAAQMYRSKK